MLSFICDDPVLVDFGEPRDGNREFPRRGMSRHPRPSGDKISPSPLKLVGEFPPYPRPRPIICARQGPRPRDYETLNHHRRPGVHLSSAPKPLSGQPSSNPLAWKPIVTLHGFVAIEWDGLQLDDDMGNRVPPPQRPPCSGASAPRRCKARGGSRRNL